MSDRRQPLLDLAFELAQVLKTHVERLEPPDGRLGEVVAVHAAHREAHSPLAVAQLDPLLFELLGKVLELLKHDVLVQGELKAPRLQDFKPNK